MKLEDSLTEFFLSKDHSPASRRWYKQRVGAFITWAREHSVTDAVVSTWAILPLSKQNLQVVGFVLSAVGILTQFLPPMLDYLGMAPR